MTVIAATSSETDDDATETTDYTAKTETLTFQVGDITKSFSVDTIQDPDDESDETFTAILSNQTNAKITKTTAKGTIQSDDMPAFEISDGMATERDNGIVEMEFNCYVVLRCDSK